MYRACSSAFENFFQLAGKMAVGGGGATLLHITFIFSTVISCSTGAFRADLSIKYFTISGLALGIALLFLVEESAITRAQGTNTGVTLRLI